MVFDLVADGSDNGLDGGESLGSSDDVLLGIKDGVIDGYLSGCFL